MSNQVDQLNLIMTESQAFWKEGIEMKWAGLDEIMLTVLRTCFTPKKEIAHTVINLRV